MELDSAIRYMLDRAVKLLEQGCVEDAHDCGQMAEWLIELNERRKFDDEPTESAGEGTPVQRNEERSDYTAVQRQREWWTASE